MRKKQLLEAILLELRNIHFHFDRLDTFFKMVHGIKEDGKTGAWIEGGKKKQNVKD